MHMKVGMWIVKDPLRRALATSALTIATSVAIAVFIRTIGTNNGVLWEQAPFTVWLYVLIVLFVVYAVVQTAAFTFDKKIAIDIQKNNPYVYVEQQCLDEYAEQCKKMLKKGQLDKYSKALDRLPGKEKRP